ncbi:MAG: DUF4097 domain-containing protein [Oscillospiraceae bacterium]|jgi:DUF4097 and DUF4098 domain-containing protein YvlB|nr:DUF4097 domain-containing protein [Oscillospiraceae bacterium]
MKFIWKHVWVIAAGLFVVGIVLAILGFIFGGKSVVWDSRGIHAAKAETYDFSETLSGGFNSINVNADHASIFLIPAAEYSYEIHYVQDGDSEPSAELKDGTLNIIAKSNFTFVNFDLSLFSFNRRDESYIKIYYPKNSKFSDVTLKCGLNGISGADFITNTLYVNADLGSVTFGGIGSDKSDFTLDLGSLKLSDSSLGELTVDDSNGSVNVKSITALTSDFELELGGLDISDSALGALTVNNSNGSVNISRSNTVSADLRLSLGSAKLEGDFLGRTKITNSNGSIEFRAARPEREYGYSLNCDLGSVYVNGNKIGKNENVRNDSASNHLDLYSDLGSIKVWFGGE